MDRFRYGFLAIDPGLLQIKHGAKTVLAVVAALEIFHFAQSQVALYAGMSAGFLMQSTAGNARKMRQITMAAMGISSTLAVGLGSELSGQPWAKQALLVLAAFGAFYVRRWIPGKAMFPVFAFVLTLLATVQPGGASSALPMMGAIFTGFVSAFAVYFYVLPDESLHAFRHASNLFIYHLREAMRSRENIRDALRAMHRAVAFEEEERDHLGAHAPAECEAVLTVQYEALQVSTLLLDMGSDGTRHDESEQSAERFSRDYLKQVARQLRQAQSLIAN